MKFKEKSTFKKSKKFVSTIVLYVAGSVVALIAVLSLISNIMIFKEAITQYVAQGYNYTEVAKQLIPAQLLPGVFESIAMYGGIAFVLFAAGVINEKVSKSFIMLSEIQDNKDVIEEEILQDNIVVEDIESLQQPETVEEIS